MICVFGMKATMTKVEGREFRACDSGLVLHSNLLGVCLVVESEQYI